MSEKKISLIIAFAFFFQQLGISQNNSEKFLQKVGSIDSIYSETLKENREIYVQLPESYNQTTTEKYPVVFVLDGEVLLPAVNNVLDFYSGGFMPEMVIIGISNARNRIRDLTTSEVSMMYGRSFNIENGKASNFMSFIEFELIPYITSKYRVTDFRSLIGHSYGGLFTLYALLNHSHSFKNYVAIDPSLDWDNQKLLNGAKDKLLTGNYKNQSLFMSLGGQLHMQNPDVTIDNVLDDSSDITLFSRSNILFNEMMKQINPIGLSFQWRFYPNDLHGTISLPSIMDGLIFGFKWYQMEKTEKFNAPESSKEELLSIVNYRANKLKNHFGYAVPPYPEELLIISGLMNLDWEQMEKSKMFFELATQYYPQSANSHAAMADYFERIQDYKAALNYAIKAYEISGEDNDLQKIKDLKEIIN